MTNSKPSKSARKRQYLALQELGEQLIGLTQEQLRSMALDENLRDALTAAGKITSRGALRRQRQLIGKLMREVDPEPIRKALAAFRCQEAAMKDVFHRAEEWRDRIVRNGRDDLGEFFAMIGERKEDLAALVDDYFVTASDADRRAIRRKIFRRIHSELAATVQNRTT